MATRKSASRTAARAPRTNTRQRIVERAISLFNRYGIQNVTIDHISVELKISPGNLTYHFKRKDDLIGAALDVVKEGLREALKRPEQVRSARDGAQYLIHVFRTLWTFRFFFNSLAYLLTDDRQLRKDYAEFYDWVIGTMEADISYLAESGIFRAPVAPNSFRLLSENIWGLFLNWVRMQQIETPAASTPSKQAIYEAALHLWSLNQLWLMPQYAEELLRVFQALLLGAKGRG